MLSERKPPAPENTGRIGTTIHDIQFERVLRYTYKYTCTRMACNDSGWKLYYYSER